MLKKILKLKGVVVLDKNLQKSVTGKGNCRRCYAGNGGAYNINDPNCAGCPPPHEH